MRSTLLKCFHQNCLTNNDCRLLHRSPLDSIVKRDKLSVHKLNLSMVRKSSKEPKDRVPRFKTERTRVNDSAALSSIRASAKLLTFEFKTLKWKLRRTKRMQIFRTESRQGGLCKGTTKLEASRLRCSSEPLQVILRS